jgi:hypothetical protein
MDGYIYLLSNSYVPKLVKFGYTDRDPETRASELSTPTGVPGKWMVKKSWLVPDAYEIEQQVFSALNKHRTTGEFFELSVDAAIGKIEALLVEWQIIDAGSGLSAAGYREVERKEAVKRKEEERENSSQAERTRAAHIQRLIDEISKREWDTYIKPYVNLCERAKVLYEKPSIASFGRFFGRDEIDILRSKEIYPEILKLAEQIFHAARVARKWRLKLKLQIGDAWPTGKDLQFPDGWHLANEHLGYSVADNAEVEVRIAVQKATGWSGDDALKLMRREPGKFKQLVQFAINNKSPERESNCSW